MSDIGNARMRQLSTIVAVGRSNERDETFVNMPVYRGSTVLFSSIEQRQKSQEKKFDQALSYGVRGGPNHHALEDMIAELEGGTRAQILSTGLAACTTALLACLRAGDHLLMSDGVYGPTRDFATGMLGRLGIETEFFPPEEDVGNLRKLLRPNTAAIFAESPSSHTFEVQNVPMLASLKERQDLKLILDNTWGIGNFRPFEHGVDFSVQALTKYVCGHSDVCLGSISTATEENFRLIRGAALELGQYASPDDCWLALRGARTLGVRLRQQSASALRIAQWLADQQPVVQLRYPALPGSPGHEIWKRDFDGASSLFGVVLAPHISVEASHRFIEALKLFGIGASWGGFESLVLPTTGFIRRSFPAGSTEGPALRLYIGLEDTDDLIEDLAQAMQVLA